MKAFLVSSLLKNPAVSVVLESSVSSFGVDSSSYLILKLRDVLISGFNFCLAVMYYPRLWEPISMNRLSYYDNWLP